MSHDQQTMRTLVAYFLLMLLNFGIISWEEWQNKNCRWLRRYLRRGTRSLDNFQA